MLNAPGQLLSTYTNPSGALTTPAQNPLGPFINSTYLLGPNDDPSMAGTWQIPVSLPWNFSFYGVNYSSITVTSKGFLYFGAYDYLTDLHNLEMAAPAPDYSTNGQGFPCDQWSAATYPVILPQPGRWSAQLRLGQLRQSQLPQGRHRVPVGRRTVRAG